MQKIMNKLVLYLLLMVVSFGCDTRGKIKNSDIVHLSDSSQNPASLAVKKDEQWWMERHQTILGRLNVNSELILVGNSIFHSLDNKDRQGVWENYLDTYNTINMGISGDRTENVIWRLENGSLENIHPKVAIVMIGTNNTDGNHYLNISTPEELAGGIKKICTILNAKLPGTQILLMGILPYGYSPNHRDILNKTTNRIISGFPDENPLIHYVDIGHVYYDVEGKIRPELMPDYLHPNAEGHMLMFKTLENHITRLMAK